MSCLRRVTYNEVVAYNNNAKKFTVHNRNRMITVAGVKWEPDSSGDSDELLDYFTFEQMKNDAACEDQYCHCQ